MNKLLRLSGCSIIEGPTEGPSGIAAAFEKNARRRGPLFLLLLVCVTGCAPDLPEQPALKPEPQATRCIPNARAGCWNEDAPPWLKEKSR